MAEAATRIAALVDWAVSNGAVLHPNVQVYQDPITGLSFQVKPTATAPLPGDHSEPVVRLPVSLSLSYLNAISTENPGSPLSAAIRAAALPPHVIGRLFLIKEYLAGESSFWHPYIQALPQPDDEPSWVLPPFWDDDDAGLLDGTNVELGLAKIRADIKADLAAIHAALRSSSSSSADVEDESSQRLVRHFRPRLYHWAYSVFSSRSFRPSLVLPDEQCRALLPAGVDTDDFSVLLPLFDIGNHDMTAPVRWQHCTAGSTAPDACCELRVRRTYQPGEQVFNNYSLKTNAELLLGYGFMIPATDALHNDYVHVRKRAAAAAAAAAQATSIDGTSKAPPPPPPMSDEYLISARPLSDSSSVLARARLPAVASRCSSLHLNIEHDDAKHIAPAFQHVQPDMVWDIFTSVAPAEVVHSELGPRAASDGDDGALRFLSGRVTGDEGLAYFAQTAAVIQHKVMQELERLNETDVEVGEDDRARLTAHQKLALEYRERCRAVLESTLEAMNNDDTLAAAMEAMDAQEE